MCLMTIEIARTPADNGRFGAMAALAPQQRQCELESYYPAGTLSVILGQRSGNFKINKGIM